MAALPSVVIGFVAGLYLAPLIERVVVPVLLMFVLLPLFGTAGVLVWRRSHAPRAAAQAGHGAALILPLLVLGGWVALLLGPVRGGGALRRRLPALAVDARSASPTTSATAWWSGSPWASR